MAKTTAQTSVPLGKTRHSSNDGVQQEGTLAKKQVGQYSKVGWLSFNIMIAFFKGMQRNLHVKGKRWVDRSSQKTFLASPQRQASLTGVLRNSNATSPYQKYRIKSLAV